MPYSQWQPYAVEQAVSPNQQPLLEARVRRHREYLDMPGLKGGVS